MVVHEHAAGRLPHTIIVSLYILGLYNRPLKLWLNPELLRNEYVEKAYVIVDSDPSVR